MAQCTIGAPLNFIAGRFGNEEGLAATLVAVVVDAFFDCVVEDFAGCDFGCYLLLEVYTNKQSVELETNASIPSRSKQ